MIVDEELPDDVFDRVKTLCAKGDELAMQRRFSDAIDTYKRALDLLPEPQNRWEAATWIFAAIGDAYFYLHDTNAALEAFDKALASPRGFGSPFLHLRRGQVLFDAGRKREAANELTRAYGLEGEQIFEQEHPKYLNFLQGVLRKPRFW
jgi:tetratricopeptide (TPR) repeat protein